jgi:hypothetical protein
MQIALLNNFPQQPQRLFAFIGSWFNINYRLWICTDIGLVILRKAQEEKPIKFEICKLFFKNPFEILVLGTRIFQEEPNFVC